MDDDDDDDDDKMAMMMIKLSRYLEGLASTLQTHTSYAPSSYFHYVKNLRKKKKSEPVANQDTNVLVIFSRDVKGLEKTKNTNGLMTQKTDALKTPMNSLLNTYRSRSGSESQSNPEDGCDR